VKQGMHLIFPNRLATWRWLVKMPSPIPTARGAFADSRRVINGAILPEAVSARIVNW